MQVEIFGTTILSDLPWTIGRTYAPRKVHAVTGHGMICPGTLRAARSMAPKSNIASLAGTTSEQIILPHKSNYSPQSIVLSRWLLSS